MKLKIITLFLGIILFSNVVFALTVVTDIRTDSPLINTSEIYSLDWSNVTITESQISDLTHTVDTDSNCNSTGSCSGGDVIYLEYDNVGNLTINGNISIDGSLFATDATALTIFETQISDLTHVTNGSALDMVNSVMNISYSYQLPQGCNDGEIAEYNTTSGGWDCAIDNSAASGMSNWVLVGADTGGSESITDGETVTFDDDDLYLTATRSTNTITYSLIESQLNTTIDGRISINPAIYNNTMIAGRNIVINGLTVEHNDTSSQGSSDNSARVFIQDISLDDDGHITSLGTEDISFYYPHDQDVNTTSNPIFNSVIVAENITHQDDANTLMSFPANDYIQFDVGGVNYLQMTEGEVTINKDENANLPDFVVRSSSDSPDLIDVDVSIETVTLGNLSIGHVLSCDADNEKLETDSTGWVYCGVSTGGTDTNLSLGGSVTGNLNVTGNISINDGAGSESSFFSNSTCTVWRRGDSEIALCD